MPRLFDCVFLTLLTLFVISLLSWGFLDAIDRHHADQQSYYCQHYKQEINHYYQTQNKPEPC